MKSWNSKSFKPRDGGDSNQNYKRTIDPEEFERKLAKEYTNDDNPFGDKNVETKFVWKKRKRLDSDEERQRERQRHYLLKQLKKNRLQREVKVEAKSQVEREKRDAEDELLREWHKKEDDFYLVQTQDKAKLRVKEGRASTLDWLILHTLSQNSLRPKNPVMVLEKVKPRDVGDLRHAISKYIELDKRSDMEYWDDVFTICRDVESKEIVTINPGIVKQIEDMLKGKNVTELMELHKGVKAKLASREPKDEEYWETLARFVKVAQARARLELRHLKLVEKIGISESVESDKEVGDSPREEIESKQATLDEEEDLVDADVAPDHAYSEKDHRPKKPRYISRVAKGYEWTRYNQAHYSSENPPPKVIHGYNFTLFYPDLIDKTCVPKFKVEPKDAEKATLTFTAGAPYQDVAFNIVNREWEMAEKKGFKNVWQDGVLQLKFRFKRMQYFA